MGRNNKWFLSLILALSLSSSAYARHFSYEKLWAESRTNAAPAAVEQYNFTQKLDHFNDADTRTFQQLVYIRKDFYKPGGPIFLLLGDEGPALEFSFFVTQGSMAEMYAPALNAMIILLEHRYYGQSQPTPNMTIANLRYLSAEQALADAANFIAQTNEQLNLDPSTTRWVTFGLSYSANLCAWMRLKYPHLVYAAVASSAPVQAVVEFPTYFEIVIDVFNTTTNPPACVTALHDATLKFVQLLQSSDSNDHAQLQQLFNLCAPPDSTKLSTKDIQSFYEKLMRTLASQVQLNHFGGEDAAAVCTAYMEDSTRGEPLVRLANLLRDSVDHAQYFPGNCTDLSYTNSIQDLLNTTYPLSSDPRALTVTGRAWAWQTCHEFGYYYLLTTSEKVASVFATQISLDYWLDKCADTFPGEDFSLVTMQQRINWTNTVYGGNSTLVEWNRVIFVNGDADPWHLLSVLQDSDGDSSSKDLKAIVIPRASHCEDALPTLPTDTVELREARHLVQQQLELWLL